MVQAKKKRGEKPVCIQAVRWGRKFMGQFQERSWLCSTDREIFHTTVMVARWSNFFTKYSNLRGALKIVFKQ
jgi:hypothetical protein